MILRLKRTPGIYLVGFMGSGKSTVGKLLAVRLGWSFVDLDEEIVSQEGCPIPQIFDERGEAEFRRIERQALEKRVRQVSIGRPTVVALGGGAFAQPESVNLLEANAVSVWLDCPLELIRQRIAGTDHRPLARDPEKFEALYHSRRDAYAKADYRMEDTNDPTVMVDRIQHLLEEIE